MDNDSLLLDHIESIPELAAQLIPSIYGQCLEASQELSLAGSPRVFLVGCGDSHHAGLATSMVWRQIAGVDARAISAMDFARYTVGFLRGDQPSSDLVIAVSASGTVSRTIEAARLAAIAGARVIGITGDASSILAQASDVLVDVGLPAMATDSENVVVPGVRNYVASLLGLMCLAVACGHRRTNPKMTEIDEAQKDLDDASGVIGSCVALSAPMAARLNSAWVDTEQFVFCGAGPNYGTALFSAAKVIEASGDIAIGQDLEEWAHLNYFCREPDTPTVIISPGGLDQDRAIEVAQAARTIGRRLALVTWANSLLTEVEGAEAIFEIDRFRLECMSPLATFVPAALLAAYRARTLGESYFRGFTGGRSRAGGGGASRIRTSHQIDIPPG